MSELKPCPFCQTNPIYREGARYPSGRHHNIYCNCGRADSGDFANYSDAAAAWNTRTQSPAEAKLEAIRSALERCKESRRADVIEWNSATHLLYQDIAEILED